MKRLVALLLLTGCAVGPNYRPPVTAVPGAFTGLTNATPPVIEWWTTFQDPMLDSLITRAVQSNLNLRIATERVIEARAIRGIVAANLLPAGNAGASYQRDRRSQQSGNTPPNARVERDLWQTGFDATWEIDVFGSVRRSVEAANADIGATVAGRDDVLVTLLAEVARNYVELRGFQQRLAVARQNIAAQQDAVAITTARLEAGLTSELDVAQASALLAGLEAGVPSLETQVAQSEHRLAVLLGESPAGLRAELSKAGDIPATPPEVPVGLPAELLRRRPDIRKAERDLAAATARTGVAMAEMFPKFSLSGAFGLNSQGISTFDMTARYWTVGPTIRWPILDVWRIKSGITAQTARQEIALLQYQATVLTALEDVENALVAYGNEQVRYQALARAVAANRRELEMAGELYRKGVGDYLNVLEAQRSLYASTDLLVQSERGVSVNLVALYKALGGGWELAQSKK
jgi:NodT family efflux transporter outer membrane factor (OMF) lipoprotein